MSRYAAINASNIVLAVAEWDGVVTWDGPDGTTSKILLNSGEGCGEGYTYSAGGSPRFTAPAAINRVAPVFDDSEYLVAASRTKMGSGRLTVNSTSVTVNTGKSGEVEFQRAALTGDVTASANSNSTTIANNAVTYAKMQDVSATDRLLGRQSAGSGDVEEITCTAAGRALLDDADAAAQRTTLGLVAGGAGDIWVEKAGDFAPATNTATSGNSSAFSWQFTGTPASASTAQLTCFDFVNVNNAGTGVNAGSFIAFSGIGMYPGANNTGNAGTIRGGQLYGVVPRSTSSATLGTITNSLGLLAVGVGNFGSSSTGTVTNVWAIDAQPMQAGSITSTNVTGLRIQDCGSGNTITTQLGVDVAAQTRGSGTNVGVRIAAPSGGTTNAALQLSGTGGTAASGILFGTDVTLYRSAANVLTTDDTFAAANVSGTNTGDQNVFSTIAVSGQSNVVADSSTDTLTLAAGSGITITTDASTDTVTIAASGGGGSTVVINEQTYTSSGTFTKSANCAYVVFEMCGGGGGGGNGTAGGAAGGGGGGGLYMTGVIMAADLGTTTSITVGTGGAAGTDGGTTSITNNTTSAILAQVNGGRGNSPSGYTIVGTATTGSFGSGGTPNAGAGRHGGFGPGGGGAGSSSNTTAGAGGRPMSLLFTSNLASLGGGAAGGATLTNGTNASVTIRGFGEGGGGGGGSTGSGTAGNGGNGTRGSGGGGGGSTTTTGGTGGSGGDGFVRIIEVQVS